MRRSVAVLALVLAALGMVAPARATPARQASDLSAPLLSANMCGAGLPGEAHFTLAATGDTFPHENIQAVGEAQGYDTLFDYVRPFLQAADLAYTNFDGAMLEGAGYTGYPAFNFNPALATALKNAGIGVVSTANNHILDRGPEGLDATMRVLDQNGILYHGTVASNTGANPPPPYLKLPVSREGITVTLGFVSATWGTNGIPDPYNQVNLLFDTNSYGALGNVRPGILEAVAQAKRETDLVVVAAHWGVEYQFSPRETEVVAARRLAEAGADIILGAQPHTLQPVDVIDTNGRKTLVIYSLANFLASQGAFQAQYYSATSTVFYVGLARSPDGAVRVTGYKYLPTIHVDNDTRPAPIPPQGYENVIAHVRAIMRDPTGARQVSHDPAALGTRVEICPRFLFPDAPEKAVGGDFAALYATLGGAAPVSYEEAVAVLGMPLGPVRREPTGDCQGETAVLYTANQRLEHHPEADWPYRVVGTQVGVEVFTRRYGAEKLVRGDESAMTNASFRAFYDRYGGRALFGLPISGELAEGEATVQYFERARFERLPTADANAPLIEQVRLGSLSEEYAGIAAQCTVAAAPLGTSTTNLPLVAGETRQQPQNGPAVSAAGANAGPRIAPVQPWWALLGLLVALAAGLMGAWVMFQQASTPRAVARVRARRATQHVPVQERAVPAEHPQQPVPQPPPATNSSDDDVLKELLGL